MEHELNRIDFLRPLPIVHRDFASDRQLLVPHEDVLESQYFNKQAALSIDRSAEVLRLPHELDELVKGCYLNINHVHVGFGVPESRLRSLKHVVLEEIVDQFVKV